jgi:GrpB-like predicted nucleotidyltransferase (UPF0157 family)
MPAPIPVIPVPHNPAWADQARQEGERLQTAIGETIVAVHHVGSTAIAGICAKPILDLIPVVRSLVELDAKQQVVEGMGYVWWGEYGLPGRRYCAFDDPRTNNRTIQLHCFEQSSPEITRHLAFRDYLRSHPELAHEYENEKLRCRNRHPSDSHAYGDCKAAWIRRIEELALSTGRAQ